ncbi:L-ascorbate oxidase [Physcomitrium patens]
MMVMLIAEAAVVKYDWTVDYITASPDCVEKLVLSVNNQFPSPTIHAMEGDTLVVRVTNAIPTEGVVFHWHGIHQTTTPFFDGAAYVSQCPINPGETFTYRFTVERAGTYFYHGHFGMQRAGGLFGSLIVSISLHKEPFAYDGEHSIILTDWWHKSIYEQQLGLTSIPFRFVGEPQSLLIQGRGSYNCTGLAGVAPGSLNCIVCNSTNPLCAPHVLPVMPGKTYRLRIASVASLSSLNFILEGHTLTVVQADGRYVKPFQVDNLNVYSGQSYDVLFTTNKEPSRNFWAAVNVRGRKMSTPTGLAILQYLPNPATLVPLTPTPVSPAWNDTAASVAQAKMILAKFGYEQAPPLKPDRTVTILGTQNMVDGHIKWALNNISHVARPTPVLAALKYNIRGAFDSEPPPDFPIKDYDVFAPPPTNYRNATSGSPVYVFTKDSVVDIIVQNANTLTPNNSEIHPWHLHGHDFWILGYGEGQFDPEKDPAFFNLVDPPVRNTVAVFPYGWVVIRFIANNPGAWPFHCHIEPHFHMGMGTVFAEGIEHIPELPTQTLGCGLTKRLMRL